jgi:cyclic pyranopterin phosphate synthase
VRIGAERKGALMAERRFSHINDAGKIRMVNVSRKRPTLRKASASCVVRTVADLSKLGPSANGVDPWHAARLAGIQAAKQTSNLIPLCHPLELHEIQVDIAPVAGRIEITTTVVTVHRTGVEMEALTACAVASLSILSSLAHVDRGAQIDDLVLLSKSGGKSANWGRLVEDNSKIPPGSERT